MASHLIMPESSKKLREATRKESRKTEVAGAIIHPVAAPARAAKRCHTVSIRMKDREYKAMKKLAEEADMSYSDYCRIAVSYISAMIDAQALSISGAGVIDRKKL
jgi:hypothetical protein